VCCSVLQCVAVCCSVLQCVAVCCSVLQFVTSLRGKTCPYERRDSCTCVTWKIAIVCVEFPLCDMPRACV